MTIYLINSPIIPNYGHYELSPLTTEQAKKLLDNEFVSAIGHKETAQLLSELFNKTIPDHRIQITMQTGDKAIVFRLKQRLPEGKILSKQELSKLPYELSLLTCHKS